jgi:hypothetical protein
MAIVPKLGTSDVFFSERFFLVERIFRLSFMTETFSRSAFKKNAGDCDCF